MRLAGSVVLFRTVPDLKVLVIRRSGALRFLSGFTAFPGGMSEPEDHHENVFELAKNCALRELTEELGLETAYVNTLRPHLVHIGTWATPEYLGDQFDTYFFAVEIDSALEDAVIDPNEVAEMEWVHPTELSLRWERCACLLAPPTQVIIRRLAERGAVERLTEYSETAGMPPRYSRIRPYITLFPQYTLTLPPATHTNCYLIGHDELLIVEPASSLDWSESALRVFLQDQIESGKRLKSVVLTHHHHDHVGGVADLVEHFNLEVWAHKETADRITLPVSRFLEDGDLIELDGGVCLEVFHTPGHAPGHIVLLDERSASLVVGDMVAGMGTIVIDPEDDGDMSEYLESLQLIRDLDPSCLLPSHGPVIGGTREKIDEYVSHRLKREGLILDAVKGSNCGLKQIVDTAYHDTPSILREGPHGGLAGRSALAHLEKLVKDGRVTGDRDRGFTRV